MEYEEYDLVGSINDNNIEGFLGNERCEYLEELKAFMIKHRITKIDVGWNIFIGTED